MLILLSLSSRLSCCLLRSSRCAFVAILSIFAIPNRLSLTILGIYLEIRPESREDYEYLTFLTKRNKPLAMCVCSPGQGLNAILAILDPQHI